MSYAPSFCQTGFSAQQSGRFQCWVDGVLSTWLDTGECDALFDVYGGFTSPPTELLCEGTPQKQCFAGSLPDNTDYYWKVVTKRGEELIEGPVWSFATQEICGFGGGVPASCAMDARQPSELGNASARQGWDTFVFTLACTTAVLTSTDFSVQVESGPTPVIVDVTQVEDQVTFTLSEPIAAGQWTCITYDISGQQACWGYLPGDVNGDRVSGPSDILVLIDALNGIVSIPDYRLDMDRSGVAGPEDILRLIDLLNGAAAFEPWLDATIGPCPVAP